MDRSLTVKLHRKAVNLGGSIKEQKTRNWDDKTIKNIMETIAGEHGLEINMPGDPLVAAEGQIIALGFQIGVSDLR
ncbi:MAG: phage protein D [Paracoccaceae bacterium]